MPYTYNRFQTGSALGPPLRERLTDLYACCEQSGRRLDPAAVYWLDGETVHLVDPRAFDPRQIADPALRNRLAEDRAIHDVLERAGLCLGEEAFDLATRIEASLDPALRAYPGSADSASRPEWEDRARQIQEQYIYDAVLAWNCWHCQACYTAAGVLARRLGVIRLRDLVNARDPDFLTALGDLAVLLSNAGRRDAIPHLLDLSWNGLFDRYGRTGPEAERAVQAMMAIYERLHLLLPSDMTGLHPTRRRMARSQ